MYKTFVQSINDKSRSMWYKMNSSLVQHSRWSHENQSIPLAIHRIHSTRPNEKQERRAAMAIKMHSFSIRTTRAWKNFFGPYPSSFFVIAFLKSKLLQLRTPISFRNKKIKKKKKGRAISSTQLGSMYTVLSRVKCLYLHNNENEISHAAEFRGNREAAGYEIFNEPRNNGTSLLKDLQWKFGQFGPPSLP